MAHSHRCPSRRLLVNVIVQNVCCLPSSSMTLSDRTMLNRNSRAQFDIYQRNRRTQRPRERERGEEKRSDKLDMAALTMTAQNVITKYLSICYILGRRDSVCTKPTTTNRCIAKRCTGGRPKKDKPENLPESMLRSFGRNTHKMKNSAFLMLKTCFSLFASVRSILSAYFPLLVVAMSALLLRFFCQIKKSSVSFRWCIR